jgi:uncharacterized protein with PhoU and TrkA domain
MSNHTKEPWRVELVDMENVPKAIRKIEDAERIVQCVNACTDMKDPAKEIARLRADRAVMLNAYKELVNECLNEFVHLPENRKTAEEYYSVELDLIKRMEANHE